MLFFHLCYRKAKTISAQKNIDFHFISLSVCVCLCIHICVAPQNYYHNNKAVNTESINL